MLIEEVPRALVASNEGLSQDELMLIECLNEHDKVSKNQVWAASQLMTAGAQRLAEGNYSVPAIVKMFSIASTAHWKLPLPAVHQLGRPRQDKKYQEEILKQL